MMKAGPAVAAVPCLVALLTWLSLRAIDPGAERFDRALGEIDRFATLEAGLQRDVLSARAGVLRDYDPLAQEASGLDGSLGRLRDTAAGDPDTGPALDRLAATVARQEDLVEQFKSGNALLQNSLAYFALFSSRLGAPGSNGPVAPAVSALATAMLRLTLDTSAASSGEVRERLDGLAQQPLEPGDAEATRALLAHGRLLHELLPATDGTLRALDALPLKRDQGALRGVVVARQLASRNTARWFRALLYATSLLLVCLLAHVGLQLRARARGLRRRAAFEHVIAGVSMSFVGARGQELDSAVEQALGQLARWFGAERGYVVASGSPARGRAWCQPGAAFPPGWPDRALLLADRFRPLVDGVVHVPDVARLPPGEGKAALLDIGLRGWSCAFRKDTDGSRVLLGFDTVAGASGAARAGEVGLLRMALDVVANALARQSLEQERVRLEARLAQARRLETIGVFASGVAHNVNNIVGAILGHTEMARERGADDSRFSQAFASIRQAGERARELVDQVLLFGRRRDADPSPVQVQALIAEAVSLLRASLPPRLDLALRQPAEPVVVSGVAAQLQQVILNVCDNAAQAMGHVGRVELEVGVHDFAAAQPLSHGTLAAGQYVRITVSDSGHGIDVPELERLFEPFFTTRANGHGLGLATAREIVHEHGGAMGVRSAVGVGSRFDVWLPRLATASSPGEPAAPPPPFGRGETVLLVEADPDRLARDEDTLAALGYEPVGFTRAADAVAACRASPGRFDIAVVGHAASTAATLEIAASLHDSAPALPVVLAATAAGELGADALMAAGVSNVTPWPMTATGIAGPLQSGLQRRRWR